MQHVKKPDWLKVRLGSNCNFSQTKKIVDSHRLNTICTSGRCPNMGECWERGTATFMIGGDICTRSCKFCNTHSGKPLPLDPKEPEIVAESARLMNLNYVVVTSVDRDDLSDMGATHWKETIEKIRELVPKAKIEVLIPDFRGVENCLEIVCSALPDIVGHNIETVKRLTPQIRSAAKYDTSLKVLKYISDKGFHTKSGIMLGLGETWEEILQTMDDLVSVGCQSITIGQYLQPSRKHLPVVEYIHPDTFLELKEVAFKKGFKYVESGPLVRSSYHAEKAMD